MLDLALLVQLLERVLGADARAFLLAWARALPVVTLVPAFGLAAVALPIRVALGAGMAAAVAPMMRPVVDASLPFWLLFAGELARGVPLALAVSAFLWAAIMAGGLVDNLRGARESAEVPLLDEPSSPMAALLGLLMALAFFETGGAARLAVALGDPRLTSTFAIAAERLAQSMGVAVAIAAPLAVGSVLVEAASGLIARSASPAYVLPLVAPLRSVLLLFVVWLSLDRIVELLVLLASRPV